MMDWKSLRNYAFRKLAVYSKTNIPNLPISEHSNVSQKYTIYQNPFSCRFFYTYNKVYIIPEWFSSCTDLDSYHSVHFGNNIFTCKWYENYENCGNNCGNNGNGPISTLSFSYNGDRYVQVQLCGKDGSLFKHHYPLGIDCTFFGNVIFNGICKHENKLQIFRVFHIIPFILLTMDIDSCYEKEMFEFVLLEDDTFETKVLQGDVVVPLNPLIEN
jgi:hypothetical protein